MSKPDRKALDKGFWRPSFGSSLQDLFPLQHWANSLPSSASASSLGNWRLWSLSHSMQQRLIRVRYKDTIHRPLSKYIFIYFISLSSKAKYSVFHGMTALFIVNSFNKIWNIKTEFEIYSYSLQDYYFHIPD